MLLSGAFTPHFQYMSRIPSTLHSTCFACHGSHFNRHGIRMICLAYIFFSTMRIPSLLLNLWPIVFKKRKQQTMNSHTNEIRQQWIFITFFLHLFSAFIVIEFTNNNFTTVFKQNHRKHQFSPKWSKFFDFFIIIADKIWYLFNDESQFQKNNLFFEVSSKCCEQWRCCIKKSTDISAKILKKSKCLTSLKRRSISTSKPALPQKHPKCRCVLHHKNAGDVKQPPRDVKSQWYKSVTILTKIILSEFFPRRVHQQLFLYF